MALLRLVVELKIAKNEFLISYIHIPHQFTM